MIHVSFDVVDRAMTRRIKIEVSIFLTQGPNVGSKLL